MTDQEYLEHFGILGMKWGRKKGKKKISKLSRALIKKADQWDKEDKADEEAYNKRHKKDSLTVSALKSVGKRAAVGLLVGVGVTVYSNYVRNGGSPALKYAVKKATENFILKYGKSNIVSASGDIILNRNNYRSVVEATRLLR